MSFPFPVPRNRYYHPVEDQALVCDLRPGDMVRIDDVWLAVMSLRPEGSAAEFWNVATHNSETDAIIINTYRNFQEYPVHRRISRKQYEEIMTDGIRPA